MNFGSLVNGIIKSGFTVLDEPESEISACGYLSNLSLDHR